MAARFHFPVMALAPGFDESALESPPFRLMRRAWDVSIFDLATLATKHRLHLPYQLAPSSRTEVPSGKSESFREEPRAGTCSPPA